MNLKGPSKGIGRIARGIFRLIHLGINLGAFKLQGMFVGKTVKKKFNELIGRPMIPIEKLDCSIDPDLDPNYFTANKTFRPHCGKCEAEVLGRELILTASKDGKWHAVPWPTLALVHHGDKLNLWNWISYSLSWPMTISNVDKLATVSRVKDVDGPEFLFFNGQNFVAQQYEFNGLNDFMLIGIDVLIDCHLVKVVRDDSGVDLIVPTTELVKRAKSSAEYNNR